MSGRKPFSTLAERMSPMLRLEHFGTDKAEMAEMMGRAIRDRILADDKFQVVEGQLHVAMSVDFPQQATV